MEVEEEVMKLIDAAKGLEAEAETTESESQRSDVLEEVTKLYQNATELAEHHWGLYIDNTLRTRDLWATSLKEAGQIGSAITCDLVSVERYTKSPAHGSKHEQTLDAQRRLAQSYEVLGQHKEAVEIFRSIVSKCSKSNKEIETWCDDRSNLADALFKSPDIKDVQEAVDISFATLQRCEKYFGEDHMRTCDVRFNLGAEFQKLKKYIDALDHFQKNLAILTRDTCQCKTDPSYEGLMDVLKKSIRKCERSIARQVKKEREEREAQDAKERKEQEITPKSEPEVKQKDDTKEDEDAKASKDQGTELQQPHEDKLSHEDSPDTEKRDRGAENEEQQQRGDIEEQRIREDDTQRASNESELKAKEKTEREAALERERKAQEEKDRISREEAAARKAQEEREQKAREETERAAKEEADRKAREEAERIVREEAERKAQEESERKAKALAQEEEDRKAQEEAERKAKEEAERKAKEEEDRKAEEEEDRKARDKAEREAQEEAERNAQEAADRIAREAAERKAEEEREREAMLERERLENEERERQAKEEREKAAKKEKEAQALKEQEAYVKAEQERERIEKQRQDEAERLRLEQLEHQKRQEELERERLLMEARRIEKLSADSQPQPLDLSNHSQFAEQTSQDEISPMQQYLPGVWVTNTNVDTRPVEDLSSSMTPKDLSTERTTPDHQSENNRTVEPTDESAGLHTDPPMGDRIVTGPGSEYNAMASRSIQDAPTASNKHHPAPTAQEPLAPKTSLTNSILKTFALATSTVTGIATLRPPVSNRGTRSHSVGHTKRKSMPVDLGKIKDKGAVGNIQRDPRIDDHQKERTEHTPNLSLSPVVPYVRRKSVDESGVPGGWPTVSDDREAVKSDPNLLTKAAPPEKKPSPALATTSTPRPITIQLPHSRSVSHVVESGPAAMADSWFKKLRNETHKLLDKYKGHVHPGLKSRTVKIAILDTGIARVKNAPPMIKHAASRIKTVKTAKNPLKPFEDTDGHGTHAAGLILKTCPYADLYVYRVAESDDFYPEIVAEALANAIDVKQVDIVSMSFGWRTNSSENLRKVISRAKDKGVLLFAASSNEGIGAKGIAYPARALEVIAVDSANGLGVPSDFNPPDIGKLRFTAPGEKVESAWPTNLEKDGLKRMTGTSFATPIAAAVAGLVLEFARQPPFCFDESVIDHLKRPEGMRAVLSQLLAKQYLNTTFHHLVPEGFLCCNNHEDGGDWWDAFAPRFYIVQSILNCLWTEFHEGIGEELKEYMRRWQREASQQVNP